MFRSPITLSAAAWAICISAKIRDLPHWFEELSGIGDEGGQNPVADRASRYSRSAPPEDDPRTHGQEQHDGHEEGGEGGCPDAGGPVAAGQCRELLQVLFLPAQDLGCGGAHDPLAEITCDAGVEATHFAIGPQDLPLEVDAGNCQGRQNDHGDQGQPPVQNQHHYQVEQHGCRTPEQVNHAPGDDLTQPARVAGQPGQEPARGPLVVERKGQPLQVDETLVADGVGQTRLHLPGHGNEHVEVKGLEHYEHRETSGKPAQALRGLGGDEAVQGDPGHVGERGVAEG